MTVSSESNKLIYVGDDSTVNFTFDFLIFANTEIEVILTDAAGVETVQTITTHYTVNSGPWPTGGTVTMVTAPATGSPSDELLTIRRKFGYTQLLDYITSGKFPAETHEQGLDRVVVLVQQMKEIVDRSILAQTSEDLTSIDLELPSLANRVSTFLAFDSLGNITVAAGTSANLGPVSAYIDTLLSAVDAAAARRILEALAGSEYMVATGTNTYSSTNSPVHAALVSGIIYFANFANANTTPTITWAIDAISAKNIINQDGAALLPGQLKGDHLLLWDGTNFRLLNPNNYIAARPQWIRAAQLGSDLNIAATDVPAIASMNETDIAFIDSGNDDLRLYRFDGAVWAQIGNDLNISAVISPELAALNGTDVAYIDNANDDLRLYRFDGTDWAQIGNDLNISGLSSDLALTALNGTDVAFIDSANEDLRTYRFDGTDWAQVGNDLNIPGVANPALATLNGTDIALIDSTNEFLITYRFDGTDWAQVGNSLSITGVTAQVEIAAMNGTDIIAMNAVNDILEIYRFDGTNWVQVGSGITISTTGSVALAAMNGIDVAFIEVNSKDLRTYRFAYYTGEGPYRP